jgi:hypothetical protein
VKVWKSDCEETVAGTRGNEVAPIPDLASLATEREGPTHVSRSVGDAAMSLLVTLQYDLEFQRELSPDQLRGGLSLLDRAAGMKPQNSQVGDLGSAEEGDPGADEACATLTTQGRLPAVEDLQQRTKHQNLVVVTFCGLGMAALATLTLLSRSEQLPNQSPVQLVTSASPALPVANSPPDRGLGGSEQRPSTPEVTVISLGTRQDWSGERASRKRKGASWHARTAKVERRVRL